MNFQPDFLADELVSLRPLRCDDFEALYNVASDPLIWEQHPNKNRYKRDVFTTFFEGAMASKNAFLVVATATNTVIGCTRFYDFEEQAKTIAIGYTFYARACWGKPFNRQAKKLMLDYAFATGAIEQVLFFIGASNIRSQRAILRIGAEKIEEQDISYYGETETLNFIYGIKKQDVR